MIFFGVAFLPYLASFYIKSVRNCRRGESLNTTCLKTVVRVSSGMPSVVGGRQ